VTLRPPQNLSNTARGDKSSNPLEAELRQEQAVTLGNLGREVQKTLAALKASPAAHDSAEYAELVDTAARAVWHYFIQREMCGLHEHDDAIEEFGIPKAVLARLGAF